MKRILILLLLVAHSFGQINSARILAGVNAQTGTSYAFVASDVTHLTTFSNASAIAVTLPAGTTVGFGIGAIFSTQSVGAGTVTITCSSCTIDGVGTLVLKQNQGADIYSGGSNYSAAVWGTNTFANAGVFTGAMFTDTQMNQYVTSNIGGINFTGEFQSAEGGHGATEGLSGGVNVPSGASEIQAGGLGGYAVSNTSTLTTLGFPTIAMGVYAQSHCVVNGAHCQGGDLVAFDNTGLTQHVVLTGLEVLTAPRNDISAYDAVNGMNVILNGVAGQSYFPAMSCQSQTSATWSSCLFSHNGAAVVAFAAGALGTTGTVGSQALQFNSFNGGSALFTSISATAAGALSLAPAPGQPVNAPRVNLTPGAFSSLPACASGTEGTQAAVTDSTTNSWGVTITGGGSDHVLAYCDGTKWTVAGK